MVTFTEITPNNLERACHPVKGDNVLKDGDKLQIDNVFDDWILYRIFFKNGQVSLRKKTPAQWEESIKNELNQ